MAAIAHGRVLETAGESFTGDTNWHQVISAAAGNFVANGKYLVLFALGVVNGSSTAVSYGIRCLQGATVLASSVVTREPHNSTVNNGRQYVYWDIITQGGAAEALSIEVMTADAAQTVSVDSVAVAQLIQWIRLDADLTENTDWFYAASAVEDAMSTSIETRATLTFTPPQADKRWLILGRERWRFDSNNVNVTTRLARDPSGSPVVLGGVGIDEGKDATDIPVTVQFFDEVLAAASVTYGVQDQAASGTLPDHLHSAVFALNLSKFAQVARGFTATAVADIAAYTDITPTDWTNPNVSTAGDWFVLAQIIDDQAVDNERTRIRIQVDGTNEPSFWDPGGGGQISSGEATAEIPGWVVSMPNLSVGVRDIDLDVIAQNGISGEWQDRYLVGWSMELAISGTISRSIVLPFESLGTITKTAVLPFESLGSILLVPSLLPIPHYSVVLVARIPVESGFPSFVDVDELPWDELRFSEVLDEPALGTLMLSGALSPAIKARLAAGIETASEIRIHRDNRTVYAGPIIGITPTQSGLRVSFADLLYYLRYMAVRADVRYEQYDQAQIVRSLVHNWQSQTWGHFGIRTSLIGTTGVLRDRTYLRRENPNVFDQIAALASVENGFDFSIQPYTRVMQVHYPGRGTDRSASIILDDRVIEVSRSDSSVAAGRFGSDVLVVGVSDEATLTSDAESSAIQQSFGRAAVTASFDGVKIQGTLDEHADRLLAVRNHPRYYPSPTLNPSLDLGPFDFEVGDTVAYLYDSVIGIETKTLRIRSRTVSVKKKETYTVSFE